MTEQELKNKIMEIIDTSVDLWASKNKRGQIQVYIDKLADALIAAGMKFDVSYSFTAAFNSVQAERERDLEHKLTAAEHRAEVAERALENACVVILSSRNGDQPRRLRAYYKAYLEAAEKELAEEGKDGKLE